jgi:hypothetical protein
MESQAERRRPGTTPKAADDRAEREAREAAALRENLRRRKEQARAREPQPRKDDEPCR